MQLFEIMEKSKNSKNAAPAKKLPLPQMLSLIPSVKGTKSQKSVATAMSMYTFINSCINFEISDYMLQYLFSEN